MDLIPYTNKPAEGFGGWREVAHRYWDKSYGRRRDRFIHADQDCALRHVAELWARDDIETEYVNLLFLAVDPFYYLRNLSQPKLKSCLCRECFAPYFARDEK